MEENLQNLINKFLSDSSFTHESLLAYFKTNPNAIKDFKEYIEKDEQSENHELIIKYVLQKPIEERNEILEEVCKIHRKPFITHRLSLSRVVIANEEIFLYILRNDKRFFIRGPECTSVDIMKKKYQVS